MDTPAPKALIEAQDRFIAVWGQMAGAWGISRTMAEVHALLYITGQDLCTDDIMDRLEISRGNASMSLRALLEWGIVERSHKRGDRKEYFRAEQDVWAMFRAIVRERITREVDPLLASMHEIRDMTAPLERGKSRKGEPAGEAVLNGEQKRAIVDHNQRLEEMLEFFQTLERLGQQFVSPAGRGLQVAATLLNKVHDVMGERDR
jgi:HTH-type transcriptional regulator, glycine betaine synthesis regulator